MALDFWTNIIADIVPFDHPIFQKHDQRFKTDAETQFKYPESDSKSKIENLIFPKNKCYVRLDSKYMQNQPGNTNLNKNSLCFCPCLNCRNCKLKKELKNTYKQVHELLESKSEGRSEVHLKPAISKGVQTICIQIRRIEDTICFVQNLGLRPAWRNKCLFKTPVKRKGLRKLRRKI